MRRLMFFFSVKKLQVLNLGAKNVCKNVLAAKPLEEWGEGWVMVPCPPFLSTLREKNRKSSKAPFSREE